MGKVDISSKPIGAGVLCCFISLLVLYSINFFQRTAVPGGIFSHLQNEMSLTATQITMLGSCFTYVYAFLQTFVGMIVDRYGGIKVNLVGGLLFVIGCLCFPLAHHISWMYFARICTGIGASTMFLGLVYEANYLFGRKNYAIAIGVAYFCAYAGGMVATLPFAYVIARYSWRAVLLGIGVCAVCSYLCMVVSRQCRSTAAVETKQQLPLSSMWQAFKSMVCNRYTWILVLMSSVVYSVYFVILTVLGKKFLEDIPHLSPVASANVLFCMSVIIMFSSLGSNGASRLWGNRRRPFGLSICTLSLLCSLGMAIAIIAHGAGWVYVMLFCGFALSSGFLPVNVMHLQELNEKHCTTLVTGFQNMFNYLFVAFFSMLSGIVLDKGGCNAAGVYSETSYLTLFVIFIILDVISLVLLKNAPETAGKYLASEK